MAPALSKQAAVLSPSSPWILPSSAELIRQNKVVKNVDTISVFKCFRESGFGAVLTFQQRKEPKGSLNICMVVVVVVQHPLIYFLPLTLSLSLSRSAIGSALRNNKAERLNQAAWGCDPSVRYYY